MFSSNVGILDTVRVKFGIFESLDNANGRRCLDCAIALICHGGRQ